MTKVYIVNNCPDTEEWEKRLVGFEQDSDGMWSASMYTVSKFGNLSTSLTCNRGKTLRSCMAAFKRGIRRDLGRGIELGKLVYEGGEFVSLNAEPCFYCDRNNDSVHENFKAWSASLFETSL